MFDSIWFDCENCGESIEAQTKSGGCNLDNFDYTDVPAIVAEDRNRHSPYKCKQCGAEYEFEEEPLKRVCLKLIRLK